MKTTINIRDGQTGELFDLSVIIKKLVPTLNNMSVVDAITKPVGNGFMPGYVIKKNKRTQTLYNVNAAIGDIAAFKGTSTQAFNRYMLDKIYRQDNIVISRVDMTKLKEGQGGNIIALEIADFILTAKELDVKKLLSDAARLATAMKLYTSVSKTKTADVFATVPSGNQPVPADNTFKSILPAIKNGLRISTCSDIDKEKDNRISLIRAVLAYINTIGSPKGKEKFYPFSINGIPLTEIVILCTYQSMIKIKDSETTTIINLNNPGSRRNMNMLVGFVDSVPLYITNQMAADTEYTILSNRVFSRDIDPITNYIGVVNGNVAGSAVVKADGTVVNLSPADMIIALFSGRLLGTAYFEEYFEIKAS